MMTEAQRRRLIEELEESGLDLSGSEPWHDLVLAELSYALRPKVHERRVPSFGAIVAPTVSEWAWGEATGLTVERRGIGSHSLDVARRFADGISSFLIRPLDGHDDWLVFDRPAGSERDLLILSEALGAIVIQRHPAGPVRVVGPFGVYRWDSMTWHHEPPISSWIDAVRTDGCEMPVLATLLRFAIHDLGARNIGATLVYRAGRHNNGKYEAPLARPPALKISRPADLAPLRHVLAQVDGAALFDAAGTLTEIGVRLTPSIAAENGVEGFRGMRHTSARRYSFDDPGATVIVVSESGPVTVLLAGERIGGSAEVSRTVELQA